MPTSAVLAVILSPPRRAKNLLPLSPYPTERAVQSSLSRHGWSTPSVCRTSNSEIGPKLRVRARPPVVPVSSNFLAVILSTAKNLLFPPPRHNSRVARIRLKPRQPNSCLDANHHKREFVAGDNEKQVLRCAQNDRSGRLCPDANRHKGNLLPAIKNGSFRSRFPFLKQRYCDFLCVVVWWAGAAVEIGLPFLSSRTPSLKVSTNGFGV